MDKTKPAYKALFWQVAENAVKTQIWISVCVYVLIAIVRKELKSELSLSQIIQKRKRGQTHRIKIENRKRGWEVSPHASKTADRICWRDLSYHQSGELPKRLVRAKGKRRGLRANDFRDGPALRVGTLSMPMLLFDALRGGRSGQARGSDEPVLPGLVYRLGQSEEGIGKGSCRESVMVDWES